MILLGCDPGYRNFGVVLVDINGDDKPKVLKRVTLRNGSIKQWQTGISDLLVKLDEALEGYPDPSYVGVEMISWYGKRKGSLQLAHLAGAVFAFFHRYTGVRFFTPKEVKSMSKSYKAPKGFDEHQHDALSICRLLANQG